MPESNITNLDELAAKIYQDGITKAEEQSREILDEADRQCRRILSEAEQKAERLIADSNREAERRRKSVENELRLKAKQLISDLKREIRELISHRLVKANVAEALIDTDFLKAAILEAIGFWKGERNLTLTLPERLKGKFDERFEHSIAEVLEGLTIHFSGQLEGGFRIKQEQEDFEITFSQEDFNTLFQSYLSESTNTLIFKD